MTTDITILLFTAASIGFLHTLTGPDHYLPFIVMAKARNWNTGKTLGITFLCGVGHVGSSILIGIIGIILGLGVSRLRLLSHTGAIWRHGLSLFSDLSIFFGDCGKHPENHSLTLMFTCTVTVQCMP